MMQLNKAVAFAEKAHQGQTRKYTGEPFVFHPFRVALLIKLHAIYFEDSTLCAAVLHDVIEDTSVTIEELKENFGEEVANLVYYCSSISPPGRGINRKTRKKQDAKHYSEGPSDSHTIKVADMIDNIPTIKQHDPGFFEVYRQEKLELLDVLIKADPELVDIARTLLREQK